jgi:hypothetical protein
MTLTPLPLSRALTSHDVQLARNPGNTVLHPTPVGFQLGFTLTTTHANAAFLPGQVTPKSGQPGQQMLQLGQLDLQFAFFCPSALGKNIENQRGAIEHLAIKKFFEVAALGRGKFVVKNDSIDIRFAAVLGKLIGFAFADESAGAGRGKFLHAIANNLAPGGNGQFGKFLQRIPYVPAIPGLYFHSD